MGQMFRKQPSVSVQGKCLENIVKVMKSQSLNIILQQIIELLETVKHICPCFSMEKELDLDEWKLVGEDLCQLYNKNGLDSIFKDILNTYNLIQLALGNCISVRIRKKKKEQEGEVPTKLGKKEEESDKNGVKYNFECDTSQQEKLDHSTSYNPPPSINPSWVEDEGGEKEAKTQLASPVKQNMTRLEEALIKAKNEGEDISDFINTYPVTEKLDSSGQKERKYTLFNLEKIKDLKKGCTLYGATFSYVKLLLHNLSYEILTPNDWKSIARTCLKPGQNLLWLSEFHELCRIQAQCNRQTGAIVQVAFEQLTSKGQYGENSEQIYYPIPVYEQISKAAIKAWRSLPGQKDRGEAFTKIEQGPNEPFADFVGRLQTAVIRTIGDNAATEIMTRHLAKKNANEVCNTGTRQRCSLEEIIRRCATVGTNAYNTQIMMNMERQVPS
uniref:Uncharacterized protein n=1 Tax=Sarcophilus harrisii TaxID=9305 RepID=A0A7N4NJF6_SARHA